MAVPEITGVLLAERAARDLARWDVMRASFLDDAVVRVSWFHGDGAAFVAASRTTYEAGSRAFHEIGALHVDVRGERALAHADATVHVRGQLAGVEVDVASHGRLFWRVRRVDGRWGIDRLEMVYLKDTLTPADPTTPLPPGSVDVTGLRPAYRHLTLLLRAAGHDIDQELPGADRPDLVAPFLDDQESWLAADTVPHTRGSTP